MDVKCEQCGTEYEFDDGRVTESGINVKCTHCGHIFRVARPRVSTGEHPVARTPSASFQAVVETPTLPRATTPTRARAWLIRRARTGEVLDFKDLSTLQTWILERKVTRDDEISKSGESWKPLGSIVELSSFFLVVESDVRRAPEPDLTRPTPPPTASLRVSNTPSSLPPAPPPPPRGRDDLLDTGEFRLEGPSPSQPIQVQLGATGTLPGLGATGAHDFRGRIGASTSTMAPLPGPQVSVHRTALPSTPPPSPIRRESSVSFQMPEGEMPESRGNTSRGFVIGVVVTGALFALAYVAFDRVTHGAPAAQPRGLRAGEGVAPASAAVVPRALPAAQLLVLLERADMDYYRDTEVTFKQAEDGYAEVLRLLGDSAAEPALTTRALVGRARSATARAEYQRLREQPGDAILGAAEEALARARSIAPDDVEAELAWADFARVKGDRVAAGRYLDRIAGRADTRPEAQLVRSWLASPDGEPAAWAARIDALPEPARRLPRVAFMRADALMRAGQTELATQALVELVAANPGHEPARALLERLRKQAPAASAVPAVVSVQAAVIAPETAPPTPVSPAPVARGVPAPPRVAAAASRAGTPGVSTAPPRAPAVSDESFDTLMTRGATLLEEGAPVRASKLFEQAAAQKPRSPEPLAYLGWCAIDQKKFSDALAYFGRALERSPRYADALYGTAEAYEKSGRTADARRAYETFLAAHPNGRRSDMARRRLERLP
jgi:predicted Zn finger-like uncharacterized protein